MRVWKGLASPSPWRCLCRQPRSKRRQREVIVAKKFCRSRRRRERYKLWSTCSLLVCWEAYNCAHLTIGLSLIFYLAAWNEFCIEPSNIAATLTKTPPQTPHKKKSYITTIHILDLSCSDIRLGNYMPSISIVEWEIANLIFEIFANNDQCCFSLLPSLI